MVELKMCSGNKILLVPEFDSFGGTRSYFIYLLKFYFSQNYDVAIALSKYQLDNEIESLIKKYKYRAHIIPERRTGLKRFLQYFPINLAFDIFAMFPIYLKEKPDLIVVSIGTPGMFIGLILFPVRFMYVFHTYPLKSKIIGLSSIQKLFLNLFINTNKILVTVSEYSKKQILAYWVPEKKNDPIHVIYNSAKKTSFIEGASHNENINLYRVLTLGHVNWYKNPKLWIEVSQKVIRQRPNMHVEFIWAGEGDLLEECKDLVSQIGLDAIKFVGYQENVDSLYSNSTIYFQPSLLESHGISVIDAMAHGLPCVTSDAGGLPESVVNGETGFTCPPDDVECFVSHIIRLLDNDKLRYKMGQSGKLRAEMLFSEEVQEEKMIDLYTSLLQK
ncbi:glycosyltransferase family 4 protein [Methanosarcina lacustris]|nr:glycosyltransferase family 4 protein [Methanosarcina lacustris]